MSRVSVIFQCNSSLVTRYFVEARFSWNANENYPVVTVKNKKRNLTSRLIALQNLTNINEFIR